MESIEHAGFFRSRTLKQIKFDLLRARARWFQRRDISPGCELLHLGCGVRKVAGWLNVDVTDSDYNCDLACGRLPWRSHSFSAIVSQHVIDDLDMERELIPLLRELKRMLKPAGELWLSCPDLEKICTAYIHDRCSELIKDRQQRIVGYSTLGYPSSRFMNDLIFEEGRNINLFDFDLLAYVLKEKSGFASVEKVSEEVLLKAYPGFPPRHDDKQALYIRAK